DKKRSEAFDVLIRERTPLNQINDEVVNQKAKELAYNEELSKIKEQKVIDYIKNLPEEEKKQLNIDKVTAYKSLTNAEKAKLLEFEIDNKKVEQLNSQWENTLNRINKTEEALVKMFEEGKEPPQDLLNHYEEAIQLANQRRDSLISLQNKYVSFADELEKNYDKQIDVLEAFDLIRRNYNFVDNMKATIGLGFGRIGQGYQGAIAWGAN